MKFSKVLLVCMLAVSLPAFIHAEPTTVTVRVLSKDAKFVGTGMGGMLVTIREKSSGNLLAQGMTSGATGNTDTIIKDCRKRGSALSDESSAHFTATVDIDKPTYVEVIAEGPLGHKESANTVSLTQWLIPGKHINAGDGLLLVVPGFVVDIREPSPGAKIDRRQNTLSLSAHITMMCGCPLTPQGLWNSEAYVMRAVITRNGQAAGDVPLLYAGTPSLFQTAVNIADPGAYEITVYAFDPANGNSGVDTTAFTVY